MHAFFKPVLVIFLIIFSFFYVLVKSNTIETTTEVYTSKSGMPIQTTNYIYHWDRFEDYVKDTPERMKKSFSGSN